MRKMPDPREFNALVPRRVESLQVSRHRWEDTRVGIATDESRWDIDRVRSSKRSLLRLVRGRINTHIPAVLVIAHNRLRKQSVAERRQDRLQFFGREFPRAVGEFTSVGPNPRRKGRIRCKPWLLIRSTTLSKPVGSSGKPCKKNTGLPSDGPSSR